jgi:hypothetical protein
VVPDVIQCLLESQGYRECGVLLRRSWYLFRLVLSLLTLPFSIVCRLLWCSKFPHVELLFSLIFAAPPARFVAIGHQRGISEVPWIAAFGPTTHANPMISLSHIGISKTLKTLHLPHPLNLPHLISPHVHVRSRQLPASITGTSQQQPIPAFLACLRYCIIKRHHCLDSPS